MQNKIVIIGKRSFIGTNLYTDKFWENQTLNRKIILDEIIKNKDIKLHIYSLKNALCEMNLDFYTRVNHKHIFFNLSQN